MTDPEILALAERLGVPADPADAAPEQRTLVAAYLTVGLAALDGAVGSGATLIAAAKFADKR